MFPDELMNSYGDILPKISEEDMKLISAPIDFIGMNIYTGKTRKNRRKRLSRESFLSCGTPSDGYRLGYNPFVNILGNKILL